MKSGMRRNTLRKVHRNSKGSSMRLSVLGDHERDLELVKALAWDRQADETTSMSAIVGYGIPGMPHKESKSLSCRELSRENQVSLVFP
jgi:hypothetical protein